MQSLIEYKYSQLIKDGLNPDKLLESLTLSSSSSREILVKWVKSWIYSWFFQEINFKFISFINNYNFPNQLLCHRDNYEEDY